MDVPLFLAVLAGLVSFLSPCVLPLVPAYIGYMGGRVTHTLAMQQGTAAIARPPLSARVNTMLHSLAFVLGFTLVFVAIGLLSTAFFSLIGRQNISFFTTVIGRAGGLLIIFFGLHFMGALAALFRRALANPRLLNTPLLALVALALTGVAITWIFNDWLPALPAAAGLGVWFFIAGAFSTPQDFWTRFIDRLQSALYADTRRQITVHAGRGGYAGSMVMGVIFSAGWTPCIGPIYGAILTMAATGGDPAQAGVLLTAYSLGLGIPFILAALLLDSAQGILRRLRKWLPAIKMLSGILLIAIGILVASGQLQSLSQNFAVQFADFSYQLEECTIELYEGAITVTDLPGCMTGDTSAS